MKYEIIYTTTINGRLVDCLCDIPTACGAWVFAYTEEQADRRVCELQAMGIDARYQPIDGECWADDKNWVG